MNCRRYLSFSLRTLFVLTAALAVWFGIVVHRARKQREGVAAIEAAGGQVAYSYYSLPGGYYSTPQPAGADWLRSALGDEYFPSVTFVDLREAKIGDNLFERMGGLTTIDSLLLANPNVGDHELAYLAGLPRLEFLSLLGRRDPEPQISQVGLEHLRQLPRLGALHLPESPIAVPPLQLPALAFTVCLRFAAASYRGAMNCARSASVTALSNCRNSSSHTTRFRRAFP